MRNCPYCDEEQQVWLGRCRSCGALISQEESKRVPLSPCATFVLVVGAVLSGYVVTLQALMLILSLNTPPGNPLSPRPDVINQALQFIFGGFAVFLPCVLILIHGGRRHP